METLASRVAREGALAENDAVGWAMRVARSVEVIHQRGGIHGRLSAAGLLIAADACTSQGSLIPFAELPENVAYHSPERERGEGGSQSDDTWAVAVMLYLALSGSLPFSGASDADVRLKIKSVPAPPLAVFDVGDDALQGIVDRALARDRAQRTASVAELRHELEAWRARPQAFDDRAVDNDPRLTPRPPAEAAGLAPLPPLLGDDDPDEEVTMMIKPGFAAAVRKILDAPTPVKAAIPVAAAKPVPRKPPGLAALAAAVRKAPLVAAVRDAPPAPPTPTVPVAASPDASVSVPVPSVVSTPDSPAGSPVPRASAQPVVLQRRSRVSIVAACCAVFAVCAVAGFLGASRPKKSRTIEPSAAIAAPPASVRPAASPPVTRGETTNLPAQPSSASAAPAPSSAAPALPAAPAATDVAACVVPLFPPDSFGDVTDLSFVCGEVDPIKGGSAIRSQLVRAHKSVSDAMREWAVLGWYEPAAFSVIRARCCPGAPPLQLPEVHGCAAMTEALAGIDAAARGTPDPSDKALKKAVDAYTDDVHCVVRNGFAARFGRVGNPQGGEDTMFMRIVARVVATKR